jgi:hypothetical protein
MAIWLIVAGPLPAQAQRAPAAAPAEAIPSVQLSITGPEETVIAADRMTCRLPSEQRAIDVTDIPPTAYRRDDGQVLLLAGNRQNFYLQGPSLDEVSRTACHSLLTPAPRSDPAAFQDNEWLSALYSFDGKTVLGFVHNEYHGEEHGHAGCKVTNRRNRECWYASTTLVVSRNGGQSFERPPPPGNVVAALPYRFSDTLLRTGTGAPKVVDNPADGSFHVFVTFVDRNRSIRGGQCVIKATGTDPSEWRAWDGQKFALQLASPYGSAPAKTQRADCAKVIDANLMSVKYIPSRRIFVGIGIERENIVYSSSKDLVNWSPQKVLSKISPFALWKPGSPPPIWYVSLLDPTSKSRNFDTLEQRPYLYFVRFRTRASRLINRERDVIRQRISIQ